MFRKLATLALLVLVALPFTAPFQTYDPSPAGPAAIMGHPGSTVVPLTTEPGRLTLVVASMVACPAVVSAHPPVTVAFASTRPPEPSALCRSLPVLRL
jgi:hypothetical protein